MPRIARALLDKRNAEAVPRLLKMIEARANCSVPELCRKLHAIFPNTEPRALERSWHKWIDVRSEKRTMPEMKSLGIIVRFARAKGWLQVKLPKDIGALVDATEVYQTAHTERSRLRATQVVFDAFVEMGAVNYSENGGFEAAVEAVLKMCTDNLAKCIPGWADEYDSESGKKLQIAFDSGMHYMKKGLSEAILPALESDKEQVEYFEALRSGLNFEDDLAGAASDEPQKRIGENWRKITDRFQKV